MHAAEPRRGPGRATPVTLIRKDAPEQRGSRLQRPPARAGGGGAGIHLHFETRGVSEKKVRRRRSEWKRERRRRLDGDSGAGSPSPPLPRVRSNDNETPAGFDGGKNAAPEFQFCSPLRLRHAHNSERNYHFMFEDYSSMEAASPSQCMQQYAYRAEPPFAAATINHPLPSVLRSAKPRL